MKNTIHHFNSIIVFNNMIEKEIHIFFIRKWNRIYWK